MALLRENDVLFAYKALNLIPGLPEASRRVAGAILDHFNKKDGQCDPGIERLSRMLGLNRSTVIRATEKLDELGLIEKDSHGGKAHRASYKPNWSLFRAIVEDWDARMIKGEAPSNEADQRGDMVSPVASGAPEMATSKLPTGDMVTPVSDENSGSKVAGLQRSRSQDCDVKGRSAATQTLRINPSKEPIEAEQVETRQQEPPRQRLQKDRNGLRNGWSKQAGQRSLLLPIAGGKPARSVSHAQAARAAADRRLGTALNDLGVEASAEVLDWITEERHAAAVEAEMRWHGGGMAYIREGIGGERLVAHG